MKKNFKQCEEGYLYQKEKEKLMGARFEVFQDDFAFLIVLLGGRLRRRYKRRNSDGSTKQKAD